MKTRPIDRISRILIQLRKIWLMYPNMRFGQLINNYIYKNGKIKFYQEDTELENQLKEILFSQTYNKYSIIKRNKT